MRRLAFFTPVLAIICAFAALFPGIAGAKTAPPVGVKVLAPGEVPGACIPGGGATNSYDANYGVYYSKTAKDWVTAPWCYPRWGNLESMVSGVVKPKGKYTFTAIPTEGSNSAQYAPETKSISWSFAGRRISGCKSADLSCTIMPTRRATKEWQWFRVNVSMPRTFFVDSPGSNCAGQHLCAGVSTQSWGFVGVPPKGQNVLSGRIIRECNDSCPMAPEGVDGVVVTATSTGKRKKSYKAATNKSGVYLIEVPQGSYKVVPKLKGVAFNPPNRSATVNGIKKGVDFGACGAGVSSKSLDRVSSRVLAPGTYSNPGTSASQASTRDDVGCGDHRFYGSVAANGDVTVEWVAGLTCVDQFKPSTRTYKYKIPAGFAYSTDITVKASDANGAPGSAELIVNIPGDDPNKIKVVGGHAFSINVGKACHGYVNWDYKNVLRGYPPVLLLKS